MNRPAAPATAARHACRRTPRPIAALPRAARRAATGSAGHVVRGLARACWGCAAAAAVAGAVEPALEAGWRFAALDRDGDQLLSRPEWTAALADDFPFPPRLRAALYDKLDRDGDGRVTLPEFAVRRDELLEFLDRTRQELALEDPIDPGRDFVPYRPERPWFDDGAIYGAVFHRHRELVDAASRWPDVAIGRAPLAWSAATSPWSASAPGEPPPTLERLIRATVIVAAGEGDDFFTAGAVLVSPDGIALTNYHVAEYMREKMTALASDGRSYRVTELLAGNPVADAALIRLEGADLPWVPVAEAAPKAGARLVLVHHPENRFFTYDQGYVTRYSLIGGVPTLEISASYAPGASGCGIFNEQHQLVGLASSIAVGDGPYLAESYGEFAVEEAEEEDEEAFSLSDDTSDLLAMDAIVVKHAVPWQALRDLWREPLGAAARQRVDAAAEALRTLRQQVQAGRWAEARRGMTPAGSDAFCLDQIDALRAALEDPLVAARLRPLVQRLRLQPAVDALAAEDSPRAVDARVLEALDAAGDRWQIVTDLCDADRTTLVSDWSPLAGETVEGFPDVDGVILAVRMDVAEDPQRDPAVYLRFVEREGGWRFDGIDWPRSDAARLAAAKGLEPAADAP